MKLCENSKLMNFLFADFARCQRRISCHGCLMNLCEQGKLISFFCLPCSQFHEAAATQNSSDTEQDLQKLISLFFGRCRSVSKKSFMLRLPRETMRTRQVDKLISLMFTDLAWCREFRVVVAL